MKDLREEDGVRRAVDAAESRWDRANDAWEAVTWAIARDELVGEPLNNSGELRGFVFDGARSVDMPSIEVIYEITETQIILHDARFYDAPYYQAGRA